MNFPFQKGFPTTTNINDTMSVSQIEKKIKAASSYWEEKGRKVK